MKILRSVLLRAVCALLMGVLLVWYPDTTTKYLPLVLGALFLIPGIISIITYFMYKPEADEVRPFFPVGGVGSLLLGLLLLLMPSVLIESLMYILGGALIVAGLCQIVMLIKMRKYTTFSMLFFVLPVCVLLTGIFIVLKPSDDPDGKKIMLIITGVSCILYGVSELINAIRFYSVKKQMKAALQDVGNGETAAAAEVAVQETPADSSTPESNSTPESASDMPSSSDAAITTTSSSAADATPRATIVEIESTEEVDY